MVRASILKRGIDDTFELKVIFAMTYIKNLRLTQALKGLINPVEIQEKDILNKKLLNL